MGVTLLRAQRYSAAVEAFRRVTELQPNKSHQISAARHCVSVDRLYTGGAREPAIDIKPSAQAYSNIGALQHSRGEFALAVNA